MGVWSFRAGGRLVAVAILVVFLAATAQAAPSSAPTITEPAEEGQRVHPGDVHMEATGFSDPDSDAHKCTDWEIWSVTPSEKVWEAPCATSPSDVHIHLGDGTFVGSYAGRTELDFDAEYTLRVRFRDDADEESAWAQRLFGTYPPASPGGEVAWTPVEPGFAVEEVACGLTLPVNIALVPNPGPAPGDPLLYVSELYGNIKVVRRDGSVGDYATDLLNFNPTGNFPGSGEQGLTGLVVEPGTGDVLASLLYDAAPPSGPHYPKVVRFRSLDGGQTAAAQTTILNMAGETQGPSHQVSNLSIGPDDKLYVHMGDGFNPATALDLDSFRGKILRANLDGSTPTDNPFYDASNGINARDYIFAFGLRNPFGGAWRSANGAHYMVGNGPSIDRLARIDAGQSYGWDGSNESIRTNALYVWDPSYAPVNVAFVESQTFAGSGFPASYWDRAFVTESGSTYATGPQRHGKRIVSFEPDLTTGELAGHPHGFVEYTGTGKATAAGLAAGPDGLYFTDLYKDQGAISPIDPGARLLRVRHETSTPGATTPPALTCPQDAAPVAVASGAGAAPANDELRLGKVKRNKRRGTAVLVVHVPGPGEIGLEGRAIAPSREDAATGGRVELEIEPRRRGAAARRLRRDLKRTGKAKVKVRVTYVQTGGVVSTRSRTLKLVRKWSAGGGRGRS